MASIAPQRLPSIGRQLHRARCTGEEPRLGALRRGRGADAAAVARGVAAEAALGAVQGDAQGAQFVTWGFSGNLYETLGKHRKTIGKWWFNGILMGYTLW